VCQKYFVYFTELLKITLDKRRYILYNGNIRRKEIIMSYYPKVVADKMVKGLETELQKICEIGKVLREDGNSRIEVNYYMNVDEDFISDVLGCYK